MKTVTKQAAEALFASQNFKKSNTEVRDGRMYLHGNKIAEIKHEVGADGIRRANIYVDSCGYMSRTTKERLNGLFPYVNISQRRGQWFLNDVEWDGRRIHVCSLLDPLAIHKENALDILGLFDGSAFDSTFEEFAKMGRNDMAEINAAIGELTADGVVVKAWNEMLQKYEYGIKPIAMYVQSA